MLHRSLNSLPNEPVSHNPRVLKKVWVRRGEAGDLTQASRAVLPPGESCPTHSHADMWEMFIVEEGTGTLVVDGQQIGLEANTCVVVSPGERHELRNPSQADLVVLTIGWEMDKLNNPGEGKNLTGSAEWQTVKSIANG